MPQIIVPEDTFRRLAERAADLNISVDELVKPALDRLAEVELASTDALAPLTGDAWRAELEAWKRDADNRAGRYTPGFVLDDSREAIYRETMGQTETMGSDLVFDFPAWETKNQVCPSSPSNSEISRNPAMNLFFRSLLPSFRARVRYE